MVAIYHNNKIEAVCRNPIYAREKIEDFYAVSHHIENPELDLRWESAPNNRLYLSVWSDNSDGFISSGYFIEPVEELI